MSTLEAYLKSMWKMASYDALNNIPPREPRNPDYMRYYNDYKGRSVILPKDDYLKNIFKKDDK